jgi:hypothetical protein
MRKPVFFSALLAKKAHYRLLANTILLSKSGTLLLLFIETNQYEAIKNNRDQLECIVRISILNKSLLSKTYTDE